MTNNEILEALTEFRKLSYTEQKKILSKIPHEGIIALKDACNSDPREAEREAVNKSWDDPVSAAAELRRQQFYGEFS